MMNDFVRQAPPQRSEGSRIFAWSRSYLGTSLRLAVSGVTLFIVVRSVSSDALVRLIIGADLKWIAFALGFFWIAQLASSQRFFYIARRLSTPISFWFSVRLQFVGLWFNQVLPSSVGGDVVKVLMLRPRMGLGLAFRMTLLDRGAGLIFLLASLVVQLPLYLRVLPDPRQAVGLALSAVTALAAIAALSRMATPTSKMLARVPFVPDIAAVFGGLRLLCSGRSLLEQVWTSAIVHFSGIVVYALAGKALGVQASLLDFVLITPLVFLFALVPISFAGWGVREFGSVWLFGLVGLSSEQSSAISIIYGLMLIIAGFPGLFLLPSGALVAERGARSERDLQR